MFAETILPTVENAWPFKGIHVRIAFQIDLWDQAHFMAMAENTITARQGGGPL